MKRIDADEHSVRFQIDERERDFLVHILQAYPVMPPAHQSVSRELQDPHSAEYQCLLNEALAEQRAANQRHLQKWLAAPGRFRQTKDGCRLGLQRGDAEWLLQVLNDVRVGHWLRLGSPEAGQLEPEQLDPKQLPVWLAMELSGYFQMSILEALQD